MSNPIANLFGHSPIKPIQKHMAQVTAACVELNQFFQNVWDGDWDLAEKHDVSVIQHRDTAYTILRELRLNMPKGLFMPVSRHDLLTIINEQHRIAVLSREISSLVIGRKMKLPKKLNKGFLTHVAYVTETCQRALIAINELDELLETGFSGTEIGRVQKYIHRIERQYAKVDKYQHKLRQNLFSVEDQMSPIDVVFTYQLIDMVGRIAAQARAVGNHLELLIAK